MSSTLAWPPQGVATAVGPQSPSPLTPEGAAQGAGAELYRDVIPRVVNVANPGAGVAWSAKPEGGRIWHVQAIKATISADATAVTRIIETQVSDGSTVLYSVTMGFGVTAAQTIAFTWMRNLGANFGSLALSFGMAPWPSIPVLGGQTISSVQASLPAGDAWTSVSLYVWEVSWLPIPASQAHPDRAETWRRQNRSPLLDEVN